MAMPDRELLFAMLAARTQLVDPETLQDSLSACANQETASLAESLEQRGVIDADSAVILNQLVDEHVKRNEGDSRRSLNQVLQGEPDKAIEDAEKTIRLHLQPSQMNPNSQEAETARLLNPKQTKKAADTSETRRSQPKHVAASAESKQNGDQKAWLPPNLTNVSGGTRFQIEKPLARGGIGEIYEATDTELNRKVALKKIQTRFVSDDYFRDRFVLEAEVTGSLEHPNIVPVYGYGVDSEGTPYYAMRLIQGKSLREKISELYAKSLSDESVDEPRDAYQVRLKKLLSRFVGVCQAVHYAHSRGVLHRDLKPDNIMIGDFGETLVLDWGLAKIMTDKTKENAERLDGAASLNPEADQDLTRTIQGAMVGTPSYMSPEQSLGWHDSLSAASDVYSLGATLYNLLTGQRLVDGLSLQETLIRTQRGEFQPPKELNQRVPAPLNAICLKALSPNASQRYQSARELADEIEAFLTNGAVKAWDEPWTSKLTRWARNHQSWVAAIASSVVLLVAFLVVGLISTTLAKQKQEQLAKAAIVEKDRAQQFSKLAQAAVESYLSEVTDDPALAGQPFQGLRQNLLATAIPFYQEIVQVSGDSDAVASRAAAHNRLGLIYDELGQLEEARNHFEQAVEAIDGLPEDEQTSEARGIRIKALVNLSASMRSSGDAEEAKATLDRASRLNKEAAGEDEDELLSLRRGARILNNQAAIAADQLDYKLAVGKYNEALEARRKLVALPSHDSDDEAEFVTTLTNLSIAHSSSGSLAKAETILEEAEQYSSRFSERGQENLVLLAARAEVFDKQGLLYQSRNEFKEAISSWTLALQLTKQLVEQRPEVLQYQTMLANVESNLGTAFFLSEDYDEAKPHFQESLKIRMAIANQDLELIQNNQAMLSLRNNLASLEFEQGRIELALAHLEASDDLLQELDRDSFADPGQRTTVINGKLLSSRILQSRGELEESLRPLIAAEQLAQELVEEYPEAIENRVQHGLVAQEIASVYLGLGDLEQALKNTQKAIAIRQAILEQSPNDPSMRSELAMSLITSTLCQVGLQPEQDVSSDLQLAIENLKPVVEASSEDVVSVRRLSVAYQLLGQAYRRSEEIALAIDSIRSAIELRDGEIPLNLSLELADALAADAQLVKALELVQAQERAIRSDVSSMLEAAAILASAYQKNAESELVQQAELDEAEKEPSGVTNGQKEALLELLTSFLNEVDEQRGNDGQFVKAWVQQEARFEFLLDRNLLGDISN